MQSHSFPYLANTDKLKLLQPLLGQPWAMLLDSAAHYNTYNQYDILCCEPSVMLSFNENLTYIDYAEFVTTALKQQIPEFDLSQPLVCMRQLLAHFKRGCETELPFDGGWVGYISYDFARHLESLPALATDDIQLPQIQMGLYQFALITDHQSKTSRLYNFGLASDQWDKIVRFFEQLLNTLEKTTQANFALTSQWQSNTTKTQYFERFNKVKDYIQAGDCYQVNLAQRFTAQFNGSPVTAYEQLSKVNKSPFSAYLNFNDHQILCLSPERFIEVQNKRVKTQPIKGTRPRHSDPQIDQQLAIALKTSEKDRAENLMIVDLLRNDLSKTANRGSVKVSELFGHYRFESVHHLISTIEAELATQYDNFDLLATSLPGGSITGAPKIRAMEIIEELESTRRNLYCGIIGYIAFNGNMDTNICIRTLIAKNQQLYCWAGGGLVADSEAEKEYQETFDKVAKILPTLEIFKKC